MLFLDRARAVDLVIAHALRVPVPEFIRQAPFASSPPEEDNGMHAAVPGGADAGLTAAAAAAAFDFGHARTLA
jgi:hypothetical protein